MVGGGACNGRLYNCTLTENSAFYSGGANYSKLYNCTLSGNTVASGGGGAGDSTLNNCTVSGNTAGSSGGGTSYGALSNCIVWGNRLTGGATSDVSNGQYFYTCASDLAASNGCFSVDPLFEDASNGNFRLQDLSPCIDAGNNFVAPNRPDMDGHVRIVDGNGDGTATVDMGAYEYGATPATFTVLLDARGAEINPRTFTTVIYGSVYGTLETPTLSGYTFAGWWTGVGGTEMAVTPSTLVTITEDQTLYANWVPNTYTVNFDPQGGTAPSPISKAVTYGSEYGTLATTARSEYIFGGWWTGTNGTGAQVISGTTVNILETQTLYAKWTLWRPEAQDDELFGVRTNRFGFNINWASGRVVVVDANTNLNTTNWLPIATNTLVGAPWYFNDSKWTNYIGRFYRIRSQP